MVSRFSKFKRGGYSIMRLLFILSSIVLLSGCVQHTKMIKPLPEESRGTLNIQDVSVSYSDLSSEKISTLDYQLKMDAQAKGEDGVLSKPLKTVFSEIAKDSLEVRDSDGDLTANVEIEVDNLKFVNPVAAVLISDTDQLSGSVKVTDSKTQELISEFYVDVLKGTGGLLGLAIRGGGVREKLAAQFSEYIGDNLGFEKVETPANQNSSQPNE